MPHATSSVEAAGGAATAAHRSLSAPPGADRAVALGERPLAVPLVLGARRYDDLALAAILLAYSDFSDARVHVRLVQAAAFSVLAAALERPS